MDRVMDDGESQELFRRLKGVCVPLMGNTLLSHASTKNVELNLAELLRLLREVQASSRLLKTSTVGYVFTPVMAILRRNPETLLPDQMLEKILMVLAILCESWWWTCQTKEWEQIFMLCGSTFGGVDSNWKGKARDEETKAAAATCMRSLLLPAHAENESDWCPSTTQASERLRQLQAHVQSLKFIPILGQTLDWLLSSAVTPQSNSSIPTLTTIRILFQYYLPDGLIPTVLPGVISSMSKTALGIPDAKGWARGDIVRVTLVVLQSAIVRALGDEICLKEGAINQVKDLDDLLDAEVQSHDTPTATHAVSSPYLTERTPSWLKGTSSQIHIALNALTPLTNHPNPTALRTLSYLSYMVLTSTSETLPQSQPLLVSFLLTLSLSSYDRISSDARTYLHRLLASTSHMHRTLLQVLAQLTKDSLASLPRLVISGSDEKVQHSARMIAATSYLAHAPTGSMPDITPIVAVGHAVGQLLGPSGRIERWGSNLLSALEFRPPSVSVSNVSAAQIMLERDSAGGNDIAFPSPELQHSASRDTQAALADMFRSLGGAAGNRCLFAVEWFLGVSRNRNTHRAVSALWCIARLLEGAGGFTLQSDASVRSSADKQLQQAARTISKAISEMWDLLSGAEGDARVPHAGPEDSASLETDEAHLHEHVIGLITVRSPHEVKSGISAQKSRPVLKNEQPLLHQSMSLQLLAVTAGILQARSTSMLLYTIYPVLQSIVSETSFLSQTGLATLQYIALHASYASPSNLLLSNFDYALDAVSRHLGRRFLDLDASKALVLLVRLVGKDVVLKAGDVVETCFDRLDEFHGYTVIVDGLVEVLNEVVRAVDFEDERPRKVTEVLPTPYLPAQDADRFRGLLEWFPRRRDRAEDDETDYGPAPQQAWGNQLQDSEGDLAADTSPVQDPGPDPEAPMTPTQTLTRQIVVRSIFFLTHGTASIRARIINLLVMSVPVLPASALMPSVHQAWPFILNRLTDPEPFVVSAAASLVEALTKHHGSFMFRRTWDDIWPCFQKLLRNLEVADEKNALARRGPRSSGVGTESAYTDSHRLYRAILRTMTAVARETQVQDSSSWEVILAFRRFLHVHAHEELQACARDLYVALGNGNEDAVWLALHATMGTTEDGMGYAASKHWDVVANVHVIMRCLGLN